ncbi:MAG: hypothetical protein A2Y12_00910 [Planctomycetes bacterium GWF2_42_9]|nr:MAG: hypothetical protein A2Y12_00910 [Planctomycetes bacterium GWF2_42_9]HAL45426.1 hypothetical protein [Phycisphaerales bacterium]
MNQVKVSIIKCPDYESQNVRNALIKNFDLHGGLSAFISKSDNVLIKPNLIAPKPKEWATQTHPAVIYELAKLLVDFGAKPFVADSPAWADARTCAKSLEILEPLEKLGVKVRQLDEPVKRRLEFCRTRVGISKYALEADKIINLPKLKTHQQLVATIAVKNMFGAVSGKAKAVWHYKKGSTFEEFCTMLIGIYKLLNPVINIIDAVTAMEGPGPIRGNPKHLGWIAASVDPIAAEIVCSDLVGIDTDKLPLVETAKKLHFGCFDKNKIDIIGDLKPKDGRIVLEQAQLVPLRFTPLRILKSIIRQIVILAKSRKTS